MTRTMQLGMAALAVLTVGAAGLAQAQGKTLGATMDVYVFPAEGQDSAAQSKDEASCYEWAVGNTGSDPFELARESQANQQQAQAEQQAASNVGRGAGAGGAVRGAAAGALIGEIANDDASEGAAWGAAVGAIRGRRRGRQVQQQASQQAASSSQRREGATAEQLNNFKKAFSVCLEAKDYLVKY